MNGMKKVHKDGWYLAGMGDEVIIYHGHAKSYWATVGYCKKMKGVCNHTPPKAVITAWDLANLHLKGLTL